MKPIARNEIASLYNVCNDSLSGIANWQSSVNALLLGSAKHDRMLHIAIGLYYILNAIFGTHVICLIHCNRMKDTRICTNDLPNG